MSVVKRTLDIFLVVVAISIFLLPIVGVALLVRLTSPGPALYWSNRIGRMGKVYRMPKFRTMYIDAPEVATDLLENPHSWLTPIGAQLRKSSLDEIPQLWSILIGDMSFVGPRPALFNQENLIGLRNNCGVNELLPGLTGWAQVNGRDDLSDHEKTAYDYEYLQNQSLLMDIKIIWLTVLKVIKRDGVSH